jgi:hypothetical protein
METNGRIQSLDVPRKVQTKPKEVMIDLRLKARLGKEQLFLANRFN